MHSRNGNTENFLSISRSEHCLSCRYSISPSNVAENASVPPCLGEHYLGNAPPLSSTPTVQIPPRPWDQTSDLPMDPAWSTPDAYISLPPPPHHIKHPLPQPLRRDSHPGLSSPGHQISTPQFFPPNGEPGSRTSTSTTSCVSYSAPAHRRSRPAPPASNAGGKNLAAHHQAC